MTFLRHALAHFAACLLALAGCAAASADTISLLHTGSLTTGYPEWVYASGDTYQPSYLYYYYRAGSSACASTRAGEAATASYSGRAPVSSRGYSASSVFTPSSAGEWTSCVYLVKASDGSQLAQAGLAHLVFGPESAPTLKYASVQALSTRTISVRAWCPRDCGLSASGYAGSSHRESFGSDSAAVSGSGWKRLQLSISDGAYDSLASQLASSSLYANVTVTAAYGSGASYSSTASVYLVKSPGSLAGSSVLTSTGVHPFLAGAFSAKARPGSKPRPSRRRGSGRIRG